MSNSNSGRRNLFEIDNARNLSRDELVSTFVATPSFWKLLSPKNHVVLGARGSGKTALLKMLSHDHLSRFEDAKAKSIIRSQELVGIYVPTKLEWVSGLKNKAWQSETEQERLFQWKVNVTACFAFLSTINSCLDEYVKGVLGRANAESELTRTLWKDWTIPGSPGETIQELRWALEDLDYQNQVRLVSNRVQLREADGTEIGPAFGTELFVPLRRAITVTTRILKLSQDARWLVCLDETEFLDPFHHRILNSFMRSESGGVFLKMTTMPYCHYTLDTNAATPLVQGHDFEYVYIDAGPTSSAKSRSSEEEGYPTFAAHVFSRRAKASGLAMRHGKHGVEGEPEVPSMNVFLGHSPLLEPRASDLRGDDELMSEIQKQCTPETVDRAKKLIGTPKFEDEVRRKLQGMLLLRREVAGIKGHKGLAVYCGASMAVRCSDGNPRRLIRIMNALIHEAWKEVKKGQWWIPPQQQTEVLRHFAISTLNRVKSQPKTGPELFDLLNLIGQYLKTNLHESGPIGTDQYSSIQVSRSDGENEWELVKTAVGLGLLFPNIGQANPDELPDREGIFRLAYVLSPVFYLLPRRGRPRALKTIRNSKNERPSQQNEEQILPFDASEDQTNA